MAEGVEEREQTGPEDEYRRHFDAADRLIDAVGDEGSGIPEIEVLTQAQVEATLALAAAVDNVFRVMLLREA